jgi:hypothetical protein
MVFNSSLSFMLHVKFFLNYYKYYGHERHMLICFFIFTSVVDGVEQKKWNNYIYNYDMKGWKHEWMNRGLFGLSHL